MMQVTAVRRRSNPYSTLLPTEVLELELSSGEAVAVFVKRLGAAQRDHPDKQRVDREPLLYQGPLAESGLPVPRCLGVGRDDDGRLRELYLEYVDGLDLRYQGLETWYRAAARLAELHRHFAARPDALRSGDVLLALDEAYFRGWAERAVSELVPRHAAAASTLSRLVERLDPAPALLAAQPPTLVHNDLAPKNAMAAGQAPERIAFVDWELAGAGCGVLDIVHLAYGLDPTARRRLFDAYWRGLDGSLLAVEGRQQREALEAACELHKTLYRLAHAGTLGCDEETVCRWVGEAEAWRARL